MSAYAESDVNVAYTKLMVSCHAVVLQHARTTQLRRNIIKVKLLMSCYASMFMLPVIVPFFKQNGLLVDKVFFLEAAFSLWLVLTDIPTGYLADRWGRKKTIALGSAFGCIGMITYAIGTNLWWFLAAEVGLATLISFHSGALDSLIKETLVELGLDADYQRVIGSAQGWRFSIQGVAAIIGGVVGLYSLRATAIMTAVTFCMGLPVALSLCEPARERLLKGDRDANVPKIIVDVMVRNGVLRNFILMVGVLFTLTLLLFWFTQAYQAEIHLPLATYGIIHAVSMFCTAIAAKKMYLFARRYSEKALFIGVAFGVIGCYIAIGMMTSMGGLIFFFLGRAAYGFMSPLISDTMNRLAQDKIRATTISIQSVVSRLIFSALAIITGRMSHLLSLNMTILFVGILSGVVVVILFFCIRNMWASLPPRTT